jgi:type VI secretion system secreted protein VgrG
MAGYTQAGRPLRVDTVFGTDVLLLGGFHGSEAVSEPFVFELDLLSTRADLDARTILGTGAPLSWETGGRKSRTIHGLVRRFIQLGQRDDLVFYRAEIVPWLWFLTLSRESRIHQKLTVPQIIELVFKDLGHSDFELRLTRSYPERDYCVQYRETHFNFVSRLMEEEGIFYFFEHTQDGHKLVLADGNNAASAVMGDGVARVQPQANAMEDVVWSIERDHSVHTGKVTLRSYDYLQPSLSLESSEAGEGDAELYDNPGSYVSVEEGDRYARIQLEAEEVPRHLMRGEGNCRNFGSGATVEISDAGIRSRTKCLLLSVGHAMSGNAYRGWDTSEPVEYRNSFLAMPLETPYRPPRRARKGLVRGTQTAVVVGPSGEEIWADKYGRVKVQFYWDRKGKRDENSSCWVRVASTWAGKSWGAIQIPRIGQEVIVDFLEGDPDRPIIIGSVYNAEQMPPYTLPDNVTQSGVKSRSSKGGAPANFNEIRMEDKKDSEQIYIHAEKDKRVVVENNRSESVGNNEAITIGNDRNESVGNNETISVSSNRMLSVGSNSTVSVGKNMALSVGDNHTESVGKNQTGTVGSNLSLSVGKNSTFEVKESHTVTIGKDHKEKVTKNYSLKAKKIHIEAEDEIEIKSGSASIILKKNGDVQIKGGKINVKGSGDVVIKGSKIGEN